MLALNRSNTHELRKTLWISIILVALSVFLFSLYEDRQLIKNFSAVGVLIKYSHHDSDLEPPFLEVFTQHGQLKRLQHEQLAIDPTWKLGDPFVKQSGDSYALVANQIYELIHSD